MGKQSKKPIRSSSHHQQDQPQSDETSKHYFQLPINQPISIQRILSLQRVVGNQATQQILGKHIQREGDTSQQRVRSAFSFWQQKDKEAQGQTPQVKSTKPKQQQNIQEPQTTAPKPESDGQVMPFNEALDFYNESKGNQPPSAPGASTEKPSTNEGGGSTEGSGDYNFTGSEDYQSTENSEDEDYDYTSTGGYNFAGSEDYQSIESSEDEDYDYTLTCPQTMYQVE